MISPALYEKILEHSSVSMLLVDSHNSIVYANTNAQDSFGYSANELTGMSFSKLVTADHHRAENTKSRISDSAIGQGILRFESYSTGIKKDGTHVPLQCKATIVQQSGSTYFLWEVRERTETVV